MAVCEGLGFPCPNMNQPQPATLVSYQGAYYYVSEVPAGGPNNTPIVRYTIWYTNSSVYCITPKVIRYAACP